MKSPKENRPRGVRLVTALLLIIAGITWAVSSQAEAIEKAGRQDDTSHIRLL